MSTNRTPTSFATVVFPRLQASGEVHAAVPERELEQIREQARGAGHSAGYAAGLRDAAADAAAQTVRLAAEHADAETRGAARIDQAVRLLAAAGRALDAKVAPNIVEVESALIETALELAQAVIGFELEDTETSARRAFERALSQADETETRTVRMHPADVLALNSTVSGSMFGSATAALPGVDLVSDPTLSRGDAVVEFSDGFLDARLASSFARARAALTGVRL